MPYENRDVSWLRYNRRVLAEAENGANPVLERLRFLSISASNLDEFFMVRYAAQRRKMHRGKHGKGIDGLTPRAIVSRLTEDARAFIQSQSDILQRQVLVALEAAGIRLLTISDLSADQLRWTKQLFRESILPCLSPYCHEHGTAFPYIAGNVLQIGFLISAGAKHPPVWASAQIPLSLPRVWRMPQTLGGGFVRIESIIAQYAQSLFPKYRLVECFPYRVTRDEDYTVPDDITDDLIAQTKKSLRKRKKGDVVRLDVDAGASPVFVSRLLRALRVRTDAIYGIHGPLDIPSLNRALYSLEGMDAYRYPPAQGHISREFSGGGSVFTILRKGDVFLHHPYDSFDSVVQYVREAASDPRVLAINMTLYRVSGKSPIIGALCDAAEAGKRVTVLLELKARFDEENNIRWAEVLKHAGCEVIYGMPHLKTHSKIALVVRREGEGLVRYVHLGTGNYNDITARQYTDMGLMTCDPALGEDAQAFFNMITGFSSEPQMQRLIYAPGMLRQALVSLIQSEITFAKKGLPCGIYAKMNALTDPELIALLYEASTAGVPIRLLVRGICCLRAGVPGYSKTIEVRSIVGRYLEHSRVFRFEHGGRPQLFLSSADWMPRNLNRRIELMFPIANEAIVNRIDATLNLLWRDNTKAWHMLPDGQYVRVPQAGEAINAQELLFELD